MALGQCLIPFCRPLDFEGVNKSSKLKPRASKVSFFEIFLDLGNLVCLMLFRSAKRRAKITNKSPLGRAQIEKCGPLIIRMGHLNWQTLHSLVWQRLTPAVVGGFWRSLDYQHKSIKKGCPGRCLEKTWFMNGLLMPKWEALRGISHYLVATYEFSESCDREMGCPKGFRKG